MEPTKEYPYGRCESCGQPGSARDDLTIFVWAGARECFTCARESLLHAMKAEGDIATLDDCRLVLDRWMQGERWSDIQDYACAPRINAFLREFAERMSQGAAP